MRATPPFAAAIATLLLHGALVAAVIAGLSGKQQESAPPKMVTVSLEQVQPAPPAPSAPSTPPVTSPAPPAPANASPSKHSHKKPPPHKPAPEPAFKPAPQASEPPAPQVKAPGAPFAAAPGPAAAAPVAPVPGPAPSAPARTGASIPASYAATNRKPPYPRLSRQNDEQGVVGLRVFVTPEGTAGAVEVVAKSGYPLLDESARSTVQSWRFSPATVDGKPVGEWYRVSIPFKLQD